MIRNFLFHRVSPHRDPLWDPMDVALFEKCIQYITRNYQTELIEELTFSEERFTKNQYASVLFDDGYKDNIEYAAPILAKYNCRASFYVVTNCIDTNNLTWTHILEHLFQHTHIPVLDLSFDFLPSDLKIKTLKTSAHRLAYIAKLKPFLKTITHENRNLVLEQIQQTYTDVELPKLMMNWNDLQQLKTAGHYIGSHSATHAMLGTMNNPEETKTELLASANQIEQALGHFPISISYPVGSFNSQTKQLSKDVGYKLGLAVKQTIYDPNKDDVFEIPRIELYNEPWYKTRLRITNSLETIKTLIGYK